jgi:parvulin-like peptidyl-prolyl isomerase|uniref:peptidylprolyl isomerase n=1 Tax=Cyanobium sp. TaxID=2164130 RepID=UPI0040479BD7
MAQPTLSGVAPERAIALAPGKPLLSVEEANRLILRHGLNRELARAQVQEAVAAVVPLAPEEEHALASTLMEGEAGSSQAGRQAWLAARGWGPEDVLAIASLAERLRRWSAWRFDEEVEIRFLDRKDDLDRVVYSLLRVSDRALAEELYLRVREEGASFRSLAEQFSEGPETETGGLIGPIAMTAAHPELAKRLRVGREGQIWPTFAIGDVWLVVRLERLLPAQLDAPTRAQMLHELFERWLGEQVEVLLQGGELDPVPVPGEALAP